MATQNVASALAALIDFESTDNIRMDVLNSREWASAFWLAALGFWLLAKRIDLFGMAWTIALLFCRPVIMRSVAFAAAYIVCWVWVLAKLGIWTTANLKTTILWSLTFALVLLMDVKRFDEDADRSLKKQLTEVFNATVFIQFLAGTYTYPLLVELVIVPVAALAAVAPAVAKGNPELAIVEKFFARVLWLIGFAILANALWQIIAHFNGFATVANAREFALPLILSLLFAPFMFVLNTRAMIDTTLSRLKFTIKDQKLRSYAAYHGVMAFGFKPELMRRWRRDLSALSDEPQCKQSIQRSIERVKVLYRRELDPPKVDPDDGWSPYAAIQFLATAAIVCKDWHATWSDDDWNSASPYFEIEGEGWKNNLAYYVDGTEFAATRLRLTMHLNSPEDGDAAKAAHEKMRACILQLVTMALGPERAIEVMKKLVKRRPYRTRANLAWLSLEEEQLLQGRSEVRFAITHRAYVDPLNAQSPPSRRRS
jgi:hypothetical protein